MKNRRLSVKDPMLNLRFRIQVNSLQLKLLNFPGENIDNNDQLESLGKINEIIRACDEINNSMVVKDIVNNTTEICMDAHILRMNHELVGKVMKLGNVEFSEQEFSNAIVS